MATIGNLLNADQRQLDHNQTNPLSAFGDILLKRKEDSLAVERQQGFEKYKLDLENQQIQQNNLRALAEAAAFNERQGRLAGLADDSTNQDKSIYSKASTLADNPSGFGIKIIKPKPAPPTAMMQLASGAFGDVMGNEIPNTQPDIMSEPTPIVPKGGRTIPRQVAQMKVGSKGEMSFGIEDNPEFKDLQDIKMKVAEAGGDASLVTDVDTGLKMLSENKANKNSPYLQMRQDKRIEDIITTIETNKPRKLMISEAEDATKRITSGIYGKVERGWTKNLAPDSPALGDYQKIKMVLLDAQLANVAFTKGAISDAEMKLFGEASANDELMSDPRMQVVFTKLNRFLKAQEKAKVSSYNKIYKEDPMQWDELQGIDLNDNASGGGQSGDSTGWTPEKEARLQELRNKLGK